MKIYEELFCSYLPYFLNELGESRAFFQVIIY